VHHRATHPCQLDGALQRALAAAGFDHHVVPARRHDGTDALTSFVLVRAARLHGDLRRTHLLGRGGGEDTDGTRSDDGDPGLRADLTLVTAVPGHTPRLHQRRVGDVEARRQRHEHVTRRPEPLAALPSPDVLPWLIPTRHPALNGPVSTTDIGITAAR
jgi:hypothetical protein